MRTTPNGRCAPPRHDGRARRGSANARRYAGLPLVLHIGINTGPVVTGGLGVGNAKSYSVTGDTVNTAQRLQSLAAPGEILVGAAHPPADPARLRL